VERVFARLFDIAEPVKTPGARRFIQDTAQALLPKGRAGAFNQALMELGALVCLPRGPRCGTCPVSTYCAARRKGTVLERPARTPKKSIKSIEVAMGALVQNGRVLVQKRPETGLMPGLWEFPGGKLEPGESPEQALCREFEEELGIKIACEEKITIIRHAYTSFKVLLHAFWCRMDPPGQVPVPQAATSLCWADKNDLGALAFPAADRKLIRILEENPGLCYDKNLKI